jgi:hypothetical protein
MSASERPPGESLSQIEAVLDAAQSNVAEWQQWCTIAPTLSIAQPGMPPDEILRRWLAAPFRNRVMAAGGGGPAQVAHDLAQGFVRRFRGEARSGRYRVIGYDGTIEIEIPNGLLSSPRLVTHLEDGDLEADEIRFPDRRVVVAVQVIRREDRLEAAGTPDIPAVTEAERESDDGNGTSRGRGPRPEKLNAAIVKMKQDIAKGELTRAELRDMLEKELAARYGVSRDTARRARNAVLAESE